MTIVAVVEEAGGQKTRLKQESHACLLWRAMFMVFIMLIFDMLFADKLIK